MTDTTMTPTLARTLKRRHVTMITLGGVIGAGLFVGSSAAIASIGPAVVISYALAGAIVLIVMRVIAALAVAGWQGPAGLVARKDTRREAAE